MTLDFWFVLLLVVLAGIWSEYRYAAGMAKAYQNAANAADDTVAEAFKEQLGKAVVIGSTTAFNKLIDRGLLKLDEKGNLTGYNNKIWTMEDALAELARLKANAENKSV